MLVQEPPIPTPWEQTRWQSGIDDRQRFTLPANSVDVTVGMLGGHLKSTVKHYDTLSKGWTALPLESDAVEDQTLSPG